VKVGPSIEQARRGNAFNATVEGGAEVLIPIVRERPSEGDYPVVRAFVSDAELTMGVATAWLLLGGLGVFLMVVTVFAADRLGRSIVRPVSDLAAAARALGDGDLDARVEPSGPEEMANVGEAFNFLASRLEALLEEERESVADLSHRLRTPLTALRLQAETLRDPLDRASLVADIDRLERAVDRLISDARRPSPGVGVPKADLGAVVRHRATFWKVLADEQDRRATVSVDDGVLAVDLPSDELGALVDTLLANVFSYTPPGTAYSITARHGPDHTAVLVIEDDGPGLPDESVLERGASAGGSTGLGLDIALRTAQRTGGELTARNRPQGGARIEVVFGRAKRRLLTGAPARWLSGITHAEPGPVGPGSER
jgi:signal transduction histidine kinase